MTITDEYRAGQGVNVVLPDIFRAVVTCCRCHEVIAFAAPVVSPLSAVEGLLTAGLLLGAGVDVIRQEEIHGEHCAGALFAYGVEAIARKDLPALAPWLAGA